MEPCPIGEPETFPPEGAGTGQLPSPHGIATLILFSHWCVPKKNLMVGWRYDFAPRTSKNQYLRYLVRFFWLISGPISTIDLDPIHTSRDVSARVGDASSHVQLGIHNSLKKTHNGSCVGRTATF